MSVETETQSQKNTEQPTWLEKVTLSMGSFFFFFFFISLGALQLLGIILLSTVTRVSLECCVLSKALNSCL